MAGEQVAAWRPIRTAKGGRGRRGRRRPLPAGDGARWLLALPIAFLLGCLVAPLVLVVTTAVDGSGLGAFADVARSHVFVAATLRTLLLAAIVTACCWVLGLAYGLGIAVTHGPLRALLLGALLAVFWTSLVVRSYGWVLLYQPSGPLSRALITLGLRDRPLDVLQTSLAMYPAMVHVMLPLMVLPIYNTVLRLDRGRIWAARSLGASPLLLLRKVVLPELRGASAAGAVLVFISSLGFYVTPALLGGPSNLTVGTLIAQEFYGLLDFRTAAAMAVLLLLAIGVLYACADRLFGVSLRWGRV